MAVWFIWMTALSTNVLNWMSSVMLKFSQFDHRKARFVYKTCFVITARQQSCGKVMFLVVSVITVRNSSCGKVVFSQASVILSTGGGMHVAGVHVW